MSSATARWTSGPRRLVVSIEYGRNDWSVYSLESQGTGWKVHVALDDGHAVGGAATHCYVFRAIQLVKSSILRGAPVEMPMSITNTSALFCTMLHSSRHIWMPSRF